MNVLLVFALGGLATYGFRVSMVVVGREAATAALADRLRFVAPAAIAAIVASALFVDDGRASAGSAAEVVAVGAALFAARRWGRAWLALVVGLPAYWIGAGLGL